MGQRKQQRNSGALWRLIAAAILYALALRFLSPLIGRPVLEGVLGVVLGLFICAHPAANAVNMLFFERYALRQIGSEWSLVRWLALNLIVLLAGLVVVFLGIRRLVGNPV
jgi:hypothetical protein